MGCGPAEQRLLLTGLHSVADIFCESCKTTLGWKYVSTRRRGRPLRGQVLCGPPSPSDHCRVLHGPERQEGAAGLDWAAAPGAGVHQVGGGGGVCFVLHSLLPLHQEQAFETSQKYKEGKYIIEMSHMVKDNGWD